MSIQRIGGGGSPTAMQALRLALRQTQAQVEPAGAGAGAVAGVPQVLAPEAVMRDIVGRAQFMTSLRAASAAVEQVGAHLEAFDLAAPPPQG